VLAQTTKGKQMSRAAHANVQVGIHERYAPWGKGVKKSTCKPPRERAGIGVGGKRFRKARARLEQRMIAHSSTLKSLSNTTPPSAFRKPGSMKK